MKQNDLPLVRGGKLPHRALDWIEHVAKFFPGVERDIVIVRKMPSSSSFARGETTEESKSARNKGEHS